jgi:hypothetical protein
MSLPVLVWVFNNSEEKLGRRLVLLCLAEHAHDDGGKAFPSVETICKRTRLSRRQAQACLRGLEDDGAIEHTGVTRTGTRIYRVVMEERTPVPGAVSSGGAQSSTSRGADSAPDPSGPVKNPPGAEAQNAQDLTTYFVDESRALGVDPPSRTIGQLATQAKALLREGQPPERIKIAIGLLVERRLNPSTLPSLILEAGAGPARRKRIEEERRGSNLSGSVDAEGNPTDAGPMPPPPTEEERKQALARLAEMQASIGRRLPGQAKLSEEDPETEEDESGRT